MDGAFRDGIGVARSIQQRRQFGIVRLGFDRQERVFKHLPLQQLLQLFCPPQKNARAYPPYSPRRDISP